MNFQEDWLLLHLLTWDKVWQLKGLVDVGSGQQSPANTLANSWRPDQGMTHNRPGLSSQPASPQTETTTLGEEDPSEILKGNPREETKISGSWGSPLFWGVLFSVFLCANCSVCFLTSDFFNFWLCLLCSTFLPCYLWLKSFPAF